MLPIENYMSESESSGPTTPLEFGRQLTLDPDVFELGSGQPSMIRPSQDGRLNVRFFLDMDDEHFETMLSVLFALYSTRLKAEQTNQFTPDEVLLAQKDWTDMGAPIFNAVRAAFPLLPQKRKKQFTSHVRKWPTGFNAEDNNTGKKL
jgi:hypothetical protein